MTSYVSFTGTTVGLSSGMLTMGLSTGMSFIYDQIRFLLSSKLGCFYWAKRPLKSFGLYFWAFRVV